MSYFILVFCECSELLNSAAVMYMTCTGFTNMTLLNEFRALFSEWEKVYWKLTDMVVPESSRSDVISILL